MIYNENIDLSETDKKYCVPLSFPKNELGQLKYHYARIQAEINGEVLDFLFDIGATVHIKDDCLKELNDPGGKVRGTSFITDHIFTKWRVIENAEEFSNYPMIEYQK